VRSIARTGPAPNFPLALSRRRPKGEQLREILEDAVAGLEPGQPIPSERVLAERFGVARMTVRQVVDRLVGLGLLYREHGRGTFVADRPIAKTERLTSFSEDMAARGLRPGAFVLSQSEVPASLRVAAALEIPEDAPVVRIDRLRHAGGVPMAMERAHLPADRFPGLAGRRLGDDSLYEVLEREWGAAIVDGDQRVSAGAVDADQATFLGVTPGDPVLVFERVTRDESGRVVEFTRSVYRADRYEVVLHLRREVTPSEPTGASRTRPASARRSSGSSPSR
jgi:GntR family transcriptional regulator